MSELVLANKPGLVGPGGQEVPKSLYGDIKVPNVKVVGPRLLVKVAVEGEFTTDGGVIVPAGARDVTQKGVVLVVGDGITLADGTRLESACEVGDEIIFAKYSGTSIQLERDEYLIIQESDVRLINTYRGKVFAFTES